MSFFVRDPAEFRQHDLDAPITDVEGVGDDAYLTAEDGQVELLTLEGRANLRLTLDFVQNDSGSRTIEAAQALAVTALGNIGSFPVAAPPAASSPNEDETQDGFDSTGLVTAVVAVAVSIAGLSLLLWAYQRFVRRPVRAYEGPPRLEAQPIVEPEPVIAAPVEPAETRNGSRSVDPFPIAGYAEMAPKQILAVLPELSVGSLLMVQARESLTKKRPTVLKAIAGLIDEARQSLAVPTRNN